MKRVSNDANKSNDEIQIRRIQNMYKNKLNDMKIKGDETLRKADEENTQRVIIHKNNADGKIHELKEKYLLYKDTLENERKILTENHKDIIDTSSTNFNERLERTNLDHGKRVKDLRLQSEMDVDQLENENKNMIRKIDIDYKNQSHGQTVEKQGELNSLKQQFESKKIQMDNNFHQQLIKNEIANQQKLMRNQYIQNKKIKQSDAEHDFQLKNQNILFKDKIKKTNEDFEKKYISILKEHDKQYDLLDKKIKNDIELLKKKLSQQKMLVQEKENDPFYQVSKLNPIIVDNIDHYIIKLDLPDYEKDFIKASGHGREFRLTFTRNFSDEFSSIPGEQTKFNRNESFSQKFRVKDIIDPSRIVKMHEENRTIFIVPKA